MFRNLVDHIVIIFSGGTLPIAVQPEARRTGLLAFSSESVVGACVPDLEGLAYE
jgi:hypothetical protein